MLYLLSENHLKAIPKGIWTLGFVSMFMDISSEMIHSLLPIYLVTVLGTSTLTVGFIEGIAESTAAITKIFSGTLSDYLGKRKLLAVIGYALAAFTKPVFPLAQSVGWLVAARFIDRVGKGIRGAPRDALVGDLAPPELLGACYGLRQSLDTIGAFLGPLAAILLMLASMNNFKLVFWLAVIPAFMAVTLLIVGLEEPEHKQLGAAKPKPRLSGLAKLSPAFWQVIGIGAIGTMARFSEAFLVLRAQNAGLEAAFVPLVMVIMNIVYACAAYPIGKLSDRMERRHLLTWGFVVLVAGDLVLALADNIIGVLLGVVLWGVHMGLTQGLFAALIADTAQAEQRGTAFGVYNLITGLALLIASVGAGGLWDMVGPRGTFLAGAAFAALTCVSLLVVSCSGPDGRLLRRKLD